MADDKTESSSLLSSFSAWRQKWASAANLSETEKAALETEQAEKKRLAECAKCDEYKNWMLTYSKFKVLGIQVLGVV